MFAVFGLGERARIDAGTIAVQEVGVRTIGNAANERMLGQKLQAVPADVRDPRRSRERRDGSREDAETHVFATFQRALIQ